ncbi:hypothetical protein [Winogradskyella sp. Asnod2-B02-A]|uniref:hypothetical protein n=1 Tax=Winogradskyella sp. Asnod2-B02-A TaxID=3160583 RepID=UPI0038639BBF
MKYDTLLVTNPYRKKNELTLRTTMMTRDDLLKFKLSKKMVDNRKHIVALMHSFTLLIPISNPDQNV